MGIHWTAGCTSGYNLDMNQFGMAVLGWCSKSVKLDRLVELLSNLTFARHTLHFLNQMSHQCHSKVELNQLGLAHEK